MTMRESIPSRPRYPPPLIVRATRSDVPDMVNVALTASRGNILRFVQYPTEEDQAGVQKRMLKIFETYFDSSKFIVMKALDPDTKEMTGLAMWVLNGYKKDELEQIEPSKMEVKREDSQSGEHADAFLGAVLPEKSKAKEESGGAALRQFMTEHSDRFHQMWTKDVKHIYLDHLSTHPKFQRRGIGSAMLEWGHKRADQDVVPMFLTATPIGYPVYLKSGWLEVYTPCVVDLRKWVDGGPKNDQGLGVYLHYCMARMPKTAAVEEE